MKKFLLAIILILQVSCLYAEDFIILRIPCRENETVKAILPSGEIIDIGKVTAYPAKTNWPAYTASKWCEPSSVCASAVNAIHILVRVENDRGRIISIIPSVTVAPAAERGAYFAIDVPAGTGIFGAYAPLVGSRVSVEHEGVEYTLDDLFVRNSGHEQDSTKYPSASSLSGEHIFTENDTLIIRTGLPNNQKFYMLDIENRPGGRVIAYGEKAPEVVARVMHPVSGIGRFGGGEFQSNGRIRASHAGVIDIKTAERGITGGIQIMPLKHALTSPEMINAWKMTQWMIIAPLPNNPDLEGSEPLFKNSFLPGAQLDDKLPDIFSHYGRRPLIICRRDGGEWEFLPEISGRIDDGLRDITHLRLYFPHWK